MFSTFVICAIVFLVLWYGCNIVHDLFFTGKGVVAANVVEEKEVDIGDELKQFQQFDVDGDSKDSHDGEQNKEDQSPDYEEYDPEGKEAEDSGNSQEQGTDNTSDEDIPSEDDKEQEAETPDPAKEKFGDDFDYFQEMIEGTSYSGGIDPDMYAAAIDDLENDRPGSARSFLSDIYMKEQQDAA